jgi:hypothetical protein
MNHETYEILLMKVVDGFASIDEQQAFNRHLESCESCHEELASFTQTKDTTDAMTARILLDAQIEPPRSSVTTRLIESSIFAVFLAAFIVFFSYAAITFWNDPKVEPWLRYTMTALVGGLVILFFRVLIPRLRSRGKDPYEEIDQ